MSLEPLFDSDQTSTAIPLGQSKELTMFGCLDLMFKIIRQLTKVDFIGKM